MQRTFSLPPPHHSPPPHPSLSFWSDPESWVGCSRYWRLWREDQYINPSLLPILQEYNIYLSIHLSVYVYISIFYLSYSILIFLTFFFSLNIPFRCLNIYFPRQNVSWVWPNLQLDIDLSIYLSCKSKIIYLCIY